MTPPPSLDAFAAAWLRLTALLADVGEAQWRAGKTPVAREDTTERSKGLTSDPVPAIVVDARRLALRAAVIDAEKSLEAAGRAMQAAERSLQSALERWQG